MQGSENLTPEEYFYASRNLFEMESTSYIPWALIKEYKHLTKLASITIASIPNETLTHIQTNGIETNLGTNIWKIDGFLSPP